MAYVANGQWYRNRFMGGDDDLIQFFFYDNMHRCLLKCLKI